MGRKANDDGERGERERKRMIEEKNNNSGYHNQPIIQPKAAKPTEKETRSINGMIGNNLI